MHRRRITAMLLLLLLLVSFPTVADEAAEDLTERCGMESDMYYTDYRSRIADDDTESTQKFPEGKTVSITWTDDVPVRSIFLAFYKTPGAYRILQYAADGTLLSDGYGLSLINDVISVHDDARRVTILPEEEMVLCTLHAYGAGEIPNYHPWLPTPEKPDFLIIAMHPDDDVLFMGAITPIYAAEQGRDGTILYMATRRRVRKDEALNGAWTMGLRTMPILGDFPDIPDAYRTKFADTFKKADVVREIVRYLRRLRPEVVFTHALSGEYGHWQHKLLADAVRQAVPLAADASYDPASFHQYGAWEVKKLYLHLYEENPISLPVTEPLSVFGGKTAVEVAIEAFQCHQSQLPSRHAVRNEGVYSLSDFGLVYTTVGLDTAGMNDPFEHIDPATLHASPTPEPTPEPTPKPTSEPTPTEMPTATPLSTPSIAPTSAVATAEPETTQMAQLSSEKQTKRDNFGGWIIAVVVGGLTAIGLVLWIARKKKR